MRHGGGDYVVERQGFEDLACGVKRVSVILVRKETKKEEKNISLLACPRMQAMAVAGLARLEGKAWGWGLCGGEAGV